MYLPKHSHFKTKFPSCMRASRKFSGGGDLFVIRPNFSNFTLLKLILVILNFPKVWTPLDTPPNLGLDSR